MNKILIFIIIIFILILILNSKETKLKENFAEYKGFELSSKLSKEDILNWEIAQNKLTNMFNIFVIICDNASPPIEYCAIGGTLIGAIRHKGWVPWDGDIDVAMVENEYNRFFQECQKPKYKEILKNNNIWLQSKDTTKVATHYLAKFRDLNSCYNNYYSKYYGGHTGLQLDIFILVNKKNKLYYGNYKRGWDPNVRGMDYSIMFPPKKMEFENMLISVPNNYEKYSKIAWGSYPPKLIKVDERIPHEGGGFVNPNKACDYVIKQYPELYQN